MYPWENTIVTGPRGGHQSETINFLGLSSAKNCDRGQYINGKHIIFCETNLR